MNHTLSRRYPRTAMSKFGRDEVWILAAAAVLTGLLIFTAGREPEQSG